MKRTASIKLLSIGIHVLSVVTLFTLTEIDGQFGLSEKIAVWLTSVPLAITIALLGRNLFSDRWTKGLLILCSIALACVFTLIWTVIYNVLPDNPIKYLSVPISVVWLISSSIQLVFLGSMFTKYRKEVKNRFRTLSLTPVIIPLSVGLCIGLFYSFNLAATYYMKPTKEKLDRILKSDDIHVKYKWYGGYVGYSEGNYHFMLHKYDTLVIKEEGTDYQTFERLNKTKMDLLKQSLTNSFNAHNPEMEMSGSCSNFSQEIYVRSGLTIINIKPERTDTVFGTVVNEL